MIWTPTSELMVIATAAFCISFGVIYTLIACYKWKRKNQSEEHEKLRDELLRQKFLSRRKSTSLTSPPSTVVNPNYTGSGSGMGSPYKVPTRHLRSTSASYSPTHYLSPHHRRMSTPTQNPTSVKTGICCKATCGHVVLPVHAIRTQLSPNHVHLHHPEEHLKMMTTATLGGGNRESPSRSVLIIVAGDEGPEKCIAAGTSTPSPLHTIKENPRSFLLTSSPVRSSPSHKSKPIPSKLNSRWNQKSFSFGPIPPPRKDRGGLCGAAAGGNANWEESNRNSAFSLSCYKDEEDSNGNEESERCPLLRNKNSSRNSNQKTDNYSETYKKNGNYTENDNDNDSSKLRMEKFVMDSKMTEGKDSSNWKHYRTQPRSATQGYPNSPKLFSKEQIVLEEIPYYIEEQDCN